MKFERPILYLREYLTILMQCLENKVADFEGEILSAHAPIIYLSPSGRRS